MKKILIPVLLMLSIQAQAAQDKAGIQKKITKVEKRLEKIRSSQASATNIDPEFNDDFNRKIAEKENELQALKAQLSSAA